MDEETGKHEGDSIMIEDSGKEAYTCNSCGREADTGYFYCEECHRKHKKTRQEKAPEEQLGQKEEVSEAVDIKE